MNPDRGYRKANLPPNAQRVFEGKIFDVYQWEQELYDGSTTTFERLTRPDTVAVIPVRTDGSVLLIEDSQPHRDAKLTVPTGRINEGETPEQAARRELLEETGYAVESLEPFAEEHPAAKLDWVVYWFIGRRAKQVRAAEPDPGEKIIPHPVPFAEFISLSAEGHIYGKKFAQAALEAKLDPAKMELLRKKFFA